MNSINGINVKIPLEDQFKLVKNEGFTPEDIKWLIDDIKSNVLGLLNTSFLDNENFYPIYDNKLLYKGIYVENQFKDQLIIYLKDNLGFFLTKPYIKLILNEYNLYGKKYIIHCILGGIFTHMWITGINGTDTQVKIGIKKLEEYLEYNIFGLLTEIEENNLLKLIT